MTDIKTLFEVTDEPFVHGIFTYLASKSQTPPWGTNLSFAQSLDTVYYGNFSGCKITSPLVDLMLGEHTKLSISDMTSLSDQLVNLYLTTWQKEWDTLSAQYDPIKNYDMTEVMTNDATVTQYGRTHTRTDNLTHTTTPNLTETTSGDVYGFNSNSAVHADKQTGTTTGTSTDLDTGTQTDADTGSDTSTRNYTLTRSGNIGVTTSQQMLESERELWKWNFFYDIVFPDIDKLLTIQTY